MPEKRKLDLSAKELGIVQSFLQRNNLEAVVGLLNEAGDHVRGVKAKKGAMDVPENSHTTVSFTNTEWDFDNFFDPQYPTRLTVPNGLGGRYFFQVALRWLNDPGALPPNQPNDSYYYAFITLNGDPHPAGNDARSTANDTEGGATGTTQHFTFETNLAEGDFAELRLWQGYGPHRRCDVCFQMRRVGG
ncbi:MAG: hypothetical protein DRJ61_00560 [Acidobacteria bacterium]|nr:MAG: hypothetical protein DRJ61_00560 [Acidobacteriota bacterium]